MPDISQMKSSNFLSQGDVLERPILATMLGVTQENVAKKGAEEELKWCLNFSNVEKPMVLNQINMQLIAQITGSTRTENWAGKQIVIYNDPTVSFGGRVTGGLRVRAPKVRNTAPAVPPAPRPAAHTPPAPTVPAVPAESNTPVEDDDVPF